MIGASARHLSRLYDALKLRLRSQPLIHGDETPVQVLKEKDREATSTSYMWAYYMWAYRSGEDSDAPIVLLDYQPGRGQIDPQAFLCDYRGLLMSDGYAAWRTLAGATHLGCDRATLTTAGCRSTTTFWNATSDGALASAVVCSVMLTCRASGAEPFARLRHVLTELPQRATEADINDLLPVNFVKTQAV